MKRNLYLIEFYRNSYAGVAGWEIAFAWVCADNSVEARNKVKKVDRFDEVIQCGQQAEVFPLSGVSENQGNLIFIDVPGDQR